VDYIHYVEAKAKAKAKVLVNLTEKNPTEKLVVLQEKPAEIVDYNIYLFYNGQYYNCKNNARGRLAMQ